MNKVGWYYDEQLEDPKLSVSLHPNQVLIKTEKKGREKDENGKTIPRIVEEWVAPSNANPPQAEDSERCIDPSAGTKASGPGYSLTPIAKSILMDDLNVAVANNWSPYGGDLLSNAWEQVRSAAPYAPALKSGLKRLGDSLKNDANTSDRPEWLNTIESVVGFMASSTSNQLGLFGDRLNYNLVSQGTRFSYYAGSGVAFGGLGMRFTVFPKFDKSGKILSVIDQIRTLLPYVNGRLEMEDYDTLMDSIDTYIREQKNNQKDLREAFDVYREKITKLGETLKEKVKLKDSEEVEKIKNNITSEWAKLKGKLNTAKEKIVGIADDVIYAILDAEILAWQKPPGGFRPFYKDVDQAIMGTLKLRIGDKYSISSLVCQDASFNFSKLSVKLPGNTNSPLYCDVNLTLVPATKFSNVSLEKFISGECNRYNKNYKE